MTARHLAQALALIVAAGFIAGVSLVVGFRAAVLVIGAM